MYSILPYITDYAALAQVAWKQAGVVGISAVLTKDANLHIFWACYSHARIQYVKIETLYTRDVATG